MAVLEHLPGIEVEIHSAGYVLDEYPCTDKIEVKHDDLKTARDQGHCTSANYIESSDGQSFTIKLTVEPPYKIDCSKLAFYCYIDGEIRRITHCERPRLNGNEGCWEFEVKGLQKDKGRRTKEQQFRFVKIETS
jgi:hypothetical protein